MLGDEPTAPDFMPSFTIGYRWWRVKEADDGPVLTGVVYRGFVWPHGPDASADCRAGQNAYHLPAPKGVSHRPAHVPVRGCGCGFYAYFDYPTLQTQAGYGTNIDTVRGVAVGWGKAFRHERGWRTKHARPVALLAWPHRRGRVSASYSNWLQDPTTDPSEAERVEREVIPAVADRYSIPILPDAASLQAYAADYLAGA